MGQVISVNSAIGWAALVLGVEGAVSGSAASRMVSCNCESFFDGIDLMLYVKLASRYCDNGICVSACPRDIPAQTCYSPASRVVIRILRCAIFARHLIPVIKTHSKHYAFFRGE